ESLINNAINKIIHSGKTVIFIAHRLNLVQECNKILVLKEGKIIEEGSHSELMKINNYYARLQKLSNVV
ncbi:MAG TPA: ABC transporter ATP-binding protein, partial [Vampirovibrionales bacterium]